MTYTNLNQACSDLRIFSSLYAHANKTVYLIRIEVGEVDGWAIVYEIDGTEVIDAIAINNQIYKPE
jgi:hypothetical protein